MCRPMIFSTFVVTSQQKMSSVSCATFCIREQHSLPHRDRDFDPFEEFLELSVIHPET